MTHTTPTTAPATPAPRGRGFLLKLWDLSVSPVTFVVLSIFWCLDLGIGSILAHQKDPQFWAKMDAYPFHYWLRHVGSQDVREWLWVYILVALTYLVIASLILCTLNWFVRKRRRVRGMAEVCIHLGFLLVFAGFVMGSGWGTRTQNIVLAPGQVSKVLPMGLSLKLEGTDVVTDDAGRELDTVSRVSLLSPEGEVMATGEAKANHPLIHGATVVYPQGNARTPPSICLHQQHLIIKPDRDLLRHVMGIQGYGKQSIYFRWRIKIPFDFRTKIRLIDIHISQLILTQ